MEHFRATTHAPRGGARLPIGAERRRAHRRDDRTPTRPTSAARTRRSAPRSSRASSSPGPTGSTTRHVERRVTLTNKTPIGAYRGYGQPEVNFAREVLIDRLARRLGIDPLELRLQQHAAPGGAARGTTPTGAVLRQRRLPALPAHGGRRDRLRRRCAAAGRGPRADGRLVGVGLSRRSSSGPGTRAPGSSPVAGRKFGAHESVTLRANRSGGVDLYTGVSTFGQGTETAFAQVCARFSASTTTRCSVHAGDTGASPLNTGAFASRTMIAAAGAIEEAALRAAGEDRCASRAWLLERRRPGRARRSPGRGRAPARSTTTRRDLAGRGPRRRRSSARAARRARSPGWRRRRTTSRRGGRLRVRHARRPSSSVDPETGDFDIERFVMVHDCGTPVNPMLVEGQVRGGAGAGLRRGAARGAALRPGDRAAGQRVHARLLRAHGGRPAPGRAAAHRGAVARHAVRRPRRGGDRDDPARRRDRQRDLRRARRLRRRAHRACRSRPSGLARRSRTARTGASCMKVEESFVIAQPRERLWEFFEQVDQVARCVPGVESVEVVDADELQRARHAGGRPDDRDVRPQDADHRARAARAACSSPRSGARSRARRATCARSTRSACRRRARRARGSSLESDARDRRHARLGRAEGRRQAGGQVTKEFAAALERALSGEPDRWGAAARRRPRRRPPAPRPAPRPPPASALAVAVVLACWWRGAPVARGRCAWAWRRHMDTSPESA